MEKSKLTLALLSAFMGVSATGAVAQEQENAGQPQATETEYEVIEVTAQNRSQSAQDVPIAMNILTSKDIEKAGVTDLNGLTRLAPDVQITNDTVFTRIAIRGIGTNSNDETQDQSLTIAIDGEYLNRPISLNASLFDIERVEVLRGPQGTLYGRNATGGAINIHARRPGDEFGGNASLTVGNFGQKTFEAGVDIPVNDTTAIRVAGLRAKNDGYTYHPNIDQRSNDQNVTSGRISITSMPTANLSLYGAVELVDVDQTSNVSAHVNVNEEGNRADETGPDFADGCSGSGWQEIAPELDGIQCIPVNTDYLSQIDRDNYDAPATGVGTFESSQIAARGRVTYYLDNLELSYRVGYRDSESSGQTPLAPAYMFYNNNLDSESLSQEIRLNSETEGGIIWQTGLFLFDESQFVSRGLYTPYAGESGSYITYFYRPFVDAKSYAAFGQAEIPFSDKWTAIVGVRWTKDQKDAQFDNFGFQFNSGSAPLTEGAPTVLDLEADASKFTWTAGLNYQQNSDSLYYGKISTGFKAGGFDSVGSYAPETVTAYEVGSKNRYASGRYTLNLSAFYYDYKDLQVTALIDSSTGAQTFNAGKAEIYGLESQFTAYVTESGRLTLNANYLHSQYKSLLASVPVQCLGCDLNGVGDLTPDPDNVVQPDLGGNDTPQAPKWVVSAAYDQIWDLSGGATLTGSVYFRYKDSYYTNIFNFNDGQQDAFTQTDLSLEYANADGDLRIQAYVRNLENERPVTFSGYTSAASDDIYAWNFGAPRTYGVKLSYDF
ncbi:TonB-dependent receptor [Alteromonas sp. NFXS44]|uniref:TonB-dependent receptor n=1 Tax=Alteromonas sp. NFXS44 TaxID=2818435 RepID=UPI0032DE34F4